MYQIIIKSFRKGEYFLILSKNIKKPNYFYNIFSDIQLTAEEIGQLLGGN